MSKRRERRRQHRATKGNGSIHDELLAAGTGVCPTPCRREAARGGTVAHPPAFEVGDAGQTLFLAAVLAAALAVVLAAALRTAVTLRAGAFFAGVASATGATAAAGLNAAAALVPAAGLAAPAAFFAAAIHIRATREVEPRQFYPVRRSRTLQRGRIQFVP